MSQVPTNALEQNRDQLKAIIRRRKGKRLKSLSSLSKAMGIPDQTLREFLGLRKTITASEEQTITRLAETILERWHDDLDHNELRIVQRIAWRQLALAACVDDLGKWILLHPSLNATKPTVVYFRSIALDMTYTSDILSQVISSIRSPHKINISLLMIDSTVVEHSFASPQIRAWCAAADVRFSYLQQVFSTHSEHHRLRLEVRRYNRLPSSIGADVTVDGERRYYVTKCQKQTTAVQVSNRSPLEENISWEGGYIVVPNGDVRQIGSKYRVDFTEQFAKLWGEATSSAVLGDPKGFS